MILKLFFRFFPPWNNQLKKPKLMAVHMQYAHKIPIIYIFKCSFTFTQFSQNKIY